jgi:hypothetical protein
MQLTFRHSLRRRRRFVFENIMDLEHVCVVHRKWFQNLRVRIERPDYVEYRLTGLFYGLKQEVLARGGPIDQDQYWYEFVTAVARMRVEGRLEGEDGNLMQTEVITFRFAGLLAPVFWSLRPLFVRQKQDILAADTALLEREFALEQWGFERKESSTPRVVVYGGNGFFGRIIVDDLLRRTPARIEIASRTAHRIEFPGFEDRVRFVESDLRDPVSVRRTIARADLLIVAAGPFQGMPLTALEACMAEQVPYVDVADDRDFVRRAYELGESAATPLGGCGVDRSLSGFGPGVTADPVRPNLRPAHHPNEDMHFSGNATPARTMIVRLPSFHRRTRVHGADRRPRSTRHRVDEAGAGQLPSADGRPHRVPGGGYRGPFHSAALFRDSNRRVQDRI